MIHRSRRFTLCDVATAEELAEVLTEHTWCACQGFRLAGADLLFLNDSSGPDGAQEYGVVRDSTRRQIESITFGWCTREQATGYIVSLVQGRLGSDYCTVPNQIEAPDQHGRCAHCA